MIDLSILYKSNQDGEDLLQQIKEKFKLVNSEIVQIENEAFINITITNESSKYARAINPSQSQLNCINKETMYQILGQNSVAFKRKSRKPITRYYEVLVYDTSVISIKQRILGKTRNSVSYVKQAQCQNAAELGKKAVYYLGLSFAMVKIALTVDQVFKVVDVDPSPGIRSIDLKVLINRLKKILREADSVTDKDVKMGADPEFMLARNRKMIPASTYFPHHGRVGCDNIRTRNRRQHPIGELRPQPNVSPLILTENVREALKSAVKLAPSNKLKWIAGSRPFKGYPIGGHIHFSNVRLNFALLRSLDNFLAIPILMIENPGLGSLRRKKYGFLADFRVKKYGFEYRTLSSWLISPEITRAVLCLAKIIVSHYLELDRNYLVTLEAQRAFYKGEKEYFKPIMNDLWSRIGQTEMYQQYANEVQVIQDMINNELSWNEKDDLRKAWEMVDYVKGKQYLKKRTPQPKRNHAQNARNSPARNTRPRNAGGSRRRHTVLSISRHPMNNSASSRTSRNADPALQRVLSTVKRAGTIHNNPSIDRFRSAYTTNLQ